MEAAPKSLFKYYSVNRNSLGCLAGRFVWFSSPAKLNDPFEFSWIGGKEFSKILSKMSVLCLADSPLNPLMWSHYADSHRGYCVEFEDYSDEELATPELKRLFGLPKNPMDKVSIVRNASKVEYLEDADLEVFAKKLATDDKQILASWKSAKTDGSEHNFLDEINRSLKIKHKNWEYENEYRIVSASPERGVAQPGKLVRIIFGMNTPPKDVRLVTEIAQGAHSRVQIQKMEIVTGAHKLKSRPIAASDYQVAGLM